MSKFVENLESEQARCEERATYFSSIECYKIADIFREKADLCKVSLEMIKEGKSEEAAIDFYNNSWSY